LSQIINNSRKSENNVIDASIDRKDTQLPELQQVINNSKISENTTPKDESNQKNTSTDADNSDKPVLPRETKKNPKPVVKNIHPEANAGKNKIAVEGSKVILDGSKSKDRDGNIESYHWQQIAGPSPKVALNNANDIDADFISPQVSHDTTFVFKLTVTDDKGSSDSAITTVKVVRNERVPPFSSSNIPDSSTSNLQDSSNRIEDVGNSTLE
jgi:hypothetical protein